MAVIGSIRNRLGGLLVVVVGGALVLFVVSDFLDSRRGYDAGSRSVGSINGEDVELAGFERMVNDEVEALRNDFRQNVDNNTTDQIRTSAWNEIVKQRVLMSQVSAAGFGNMLCQEEYDDIRFGSNIAADLKGIPFLQGPDGQPDPTKIKQWFDASPEQWPNYYPIMERRLIENRLYTKYNTLVKESIFANSAQAKDEHEQKNLKATFDFVVKAYNVEPDSLYPVSESELKTYYNAHKDEKKHKQQASRSFDYVAMQVLPTDEDREALRKELAGLVDAFANAVNDSAFCVVNSSTRSYNVAAYTPGSVDATTDSLLARADTGAVIGPYGEGNSWKLAKVRELADVPEARVRHILLKSDATNDATMKARADSILAVVKRDKSKFESMVDKYTEDPGSKSTGGVYEWFDKKKMVPEFTAASFDEKVGAITVCKTTYGYHIVEVLGQRTRKERRICTIDRPVVPSPRTFQEAYKKASDFSFTYNTADEFPIGADTMGLEVKAVENQQLGQRYVSGLDQPTQLLGWVNSNEVGKVSGPIQCGDNYVIALVRAVKEEGPPALEDVREAFTREVVKEKKGEAYKKAMEGKTDLSALAGELGVQVQTASDLAFNSFNIPGGYNEQEVIGRIFALDSMQVGGPYVGESGVFTVRMNVKTPATEPADLATERTALADRRSGSAEFILLNALREAAGVKDERAKFY